RVFVDLVEDHERLIRRQLPPAQPWRYLRIVPVEIRRVPLGSFGSQQRQGQSRFPDLPRSADKGHLAFESSRYLCREITRENGHENTFTACLIKVEHSPFFT